MKTKFNLVMATGCVALAFGSVACEVHIESGQAPLVDPHEDAATADVAEADSTDGGEADVTELDQAKLERGKYIVHHVSICIDCHTPKNSDGTNNFDVNLSGIDYLYDLNPADDALGGISSKNLTPHETGIEYLTDEELETFIRTGQRPEEKRPNEVIATPFMPYWTFANMTDEDMQSVIYYLRNGVDPVDHEEAPRQPFAGTWQAMNERTIPVEQALLDIYPDTTLDPAHQNYEDAEKGKYLVAVAGCAFCHSPLVSENTPPADPNEKWYAVKEDEILYGGEEFPADGFGLPSPPWPFLVYSRNLSPHENGIKDYSPEEIRIALKNGKDSKGRRMCPPMPAGPTSPFGGLKDEDALAIGWYLTTIEPVPSDWPNCIPPTD